MVRNVTNASSDISCKTRRPYSDAELVEANASSGPHSDLFPCPDCGGVLKERVRARVDFWLECDRCGWDKMMERSIPAPRVTNKGAPYLKWARKTSERDHA